VAPTLNLPGKFAGWHRCGLLCFQAHVAAFLTRILMVMHNLGRLTLLTCVSMPTC
jgi:hypothetical protein